MNNKGEEMRPAIIECDFCNTVISDEEHYLNFDLDDILRDDYQLSSSQKDNSEIFACMACKARYENFMEELMLWINKEQERWRIAA